MRPHSILPLIVGILSLAIHAMAIDTIPRGLYVDETSIGINAATIAKSHVDEHGVSFPLYFRAFGEWKNPLYIYTAAGMFTFFGVSERSLRMTSVFFFALFLWGTWVYAKTVFPETPATRWYALICAGTLPWFFTLSRIAFEVISQIGVGIWLVVFLYRAYRGPFKNDDLKTVSAAMSGVLLALFLYSYSTSRVLAFGIPLALLISFPSKKYWKTHVLVISTFLILVLPYFLFIRNHPGALSSRFELITYLYAHDLSTIEKIAKFIENYFSAFDISRFWILKGDPNLRHATGYMGQLFIVPLLLFFAGMWHMITRLFFKDAFERQWSIFLLLVFLGAGIPAALTNDSHHSLRLLFWGMIVFCISLAGFAALQIRFKNRRRLIALVCCAGILCQAGLYFHDYFTKYPNWSIGAFAGYELPEAILWAKNQSPTRILFFESPNSSVYASLAFYNTIYATNATLSTVPPQTGTCRIWYKWNKPESPPLSPRSTFPGAANGIIAGECY